MHLHVINLNFLSARPEQLAGITQSDQLSLSGKVVPNDCSQQAVATMNSVTGNTVHNWHRLLIAVTRDINSNPQAAGQDMEGRKPCGRLH